MNLNRHSPNLVGKHAFLSPSTYHWINYDEDKLDQVFFAAEAARRGTELHELAQRLISLGVKLPKANKTLNLYVNDAIGFRMTPEQTLFYSENCFGTTDAICFRVNKLRVHDLKTGVNEASMVQLRIYDALFCLEYKFNPLEIEIENRIYQNDEVRIESPDPAEILHIMEKIRYFDKRVTALRMEAE